MAMSEGTVEETPLKRQDFYSVRFRLCGLVARVPGYRTRGPGSISDAITFSEK
jgi:hypothetical protein